MNFRKLYLMMSLTLGVLALNGQDGDIDRTSRTEIQLLDGEDITVTITGAEYVRTGALSPQAFVPMNAPSALSISAVDATSLTSTTN